MYLSKTKAAGTGNWRVPKSCDMRVALALRRWTCQAVSLSVSFLPRTKSGSELNGSSPFPAHLRAPKTAVTVIVVSQRASPPTAPCHSGAGSTWSPPVFRYDLRRSQPVRCSARQGSRGRVSGRRFGIGRGASRRHGITRSQASEPWGNSSIAANSQRNSQ